MSRILSKVLLLACLLFSCMTLEAGQYRYCRRPLPPKQCGFYAGAAILVWEPCAAFQYGFRQAVTGVTTQDYELFLTNDYQVGFEVILGVTGVCKCLFSDVAYARLFTYNTRKLSADNLFLFLNGITIQVAQGLAHTETEFERVTARLGTNLCHKCNVRLYGYGGLQFLHLGISHITRGLLTFGDRIQDNEVNQFYGGSALLGLGAEYLIPCGLGVEACANVLGAIGNRVIKWQDRQFDPTGVLISRTVQIEPIRLACIPGFEIKVAGFLNYDVCYFKLRGEIGWAFNYYYHVFLLREPQQSTNITIPHSFALSGPYAGLKLYY